MIPKISSVSVRNNNYHNSFNTNSIKQTFGASAAQFEDKSTELRIENLLDLDGNLLIKDTDVNPKHRSTIFSSGEKGLEILKEKDVDKTYMLIRSIGADGNKNVIGEIVVKNNSYLPVITYKQGKFKPEITVKHSELKGSRVKMLAGSELKTKNFSVKMPGNYSPDGSTKKAVAFSGDIALTTLQLEERTRNAVKTYFDSKLYDKVIPGAHQDDVKKHSPNIIIPAGGVGSRFYNITRDLENKPSTTMPTDKGYRVMGTTLNMAAATGMLTKDSEKDVKYVSQNGDIKGTNVVNVTKYKNDGGAIAEALALKAIDDSKDTIILNADIFSNADITRAYHALKTLPQAALIIPYYPVNPQRAKSFGLLGTEKDKHGNLLLKEFVEKPKYTDVPPTEPNRENFDSDAAFEKYKNVEYPKLMANYNKALTARLDDGNFLANPGMYVMSKEAAEVLKNMKILFDGETFADGKSGEEKLGLGADVMPKIVSLCNKGLLRNDKGEVMKAYTVPLQRPDGKNAFWDDIGTAEAFLKVVKDVAKETGKTGTGPKNKFYGMPEFVLKDFMKNSDLETGVVYQSPLAKSNFNNFANKLEVETLKGNVYIVD